MTGLVEKLRQVVPDVSAQVCASEADFNAYWELKIRALQAFQCDLLTEAISSKKESPWTVVDIGDSAGTHMFYLQSLVGAGIPIQTLSVNLDPRAIAKIRARGLPALLSRAEDLKLDHPVDLFVSFEMLEHLNNPALFLRRLSKRDDGSRLVLTVPLLRSSRVGLSHIRKKSLCTVHAEDVHVFELSREDWKLLFLFAGWRVVRERVYWQYPRGWPVLSNLIARWWRRSDYEGFWGVELERDRRYADLYLDWET